MKVCEKNTRTSIKAPVIGTAKVLVYEEIVEARQIHDVKKSLQPEVDRPQSAAHQPPLKSQERYQEAMRKMKQ